MPSHFPSSNAAHASANVLHVLGSLLSAFARARLCFGTFAQRPLTHSWAQTHQRSASRSAAGMASASAGTTRTIGLAADAR